MSKSKRKRVSKSPSSKASKTTEKTSSGRVGGPKDTGPKSSNAARSTLSRGSQTGAQTERKPPWFLILGGIAVVVVIVVLVVVGLGRDRETTTGLPAEGYGSPTEMASASNTGELAVASTPAVDSGALDGDMPEDPVARNGMYYNRPIDVDRSEESLCRDVRDRTREHRG